MTSIYAVIILIITCSHLRIASGALYEQRAAAIASTTTTTNCLTGKENVKADTKIQCALKCRLRQKNALFDLHGDCMCYTEIKEAKCNQDEGAGEKIKGQLIKQHRLPRCPRNFHGKDCELYKGEGTEMINPALSCKKIKLEFRLAKTGYYWVHLKTDSIRVFCDMDTSGGGWTLIGNVTLARDSEAASRTYTSARSFALTSLGQLEDGKKVLDGSLFPYLQAAEGIKQFRIFCTKKYHGRTFHMATRVSPNGLKFRDYLVGKRDSWLEKPTDCKEAVERLPDDTSLLMEACVSSPQYVMSKSIRSKEARLYDHVLYEHGNLHVQLLENNRLECDDFEPKHSLSGDYSQVGQWLYYVR